MANSIKTSNINDIKTPTLTQLGKNVLSQYLSNEELDILIKYSHVRDYLPAETLLKQGEKTENFYILIEGDANVSARIMGQGTTNMEKLNPGDFFGNFFTLEPTPSTTSVVAVSRVTCLVISNFYFALLAITHLETKYKILEALSHQICRRLKQVHDKVTSYISDTAMISLSLFGKVVGHFSQPKSISFHESNIDKDHFLLVDLFKEFDQEERETLFKHIELLEASKDCKLIHEGEKKPSCYIVIKGAIQSSIIHKNKLAKLSVIGPETLFAGVACIDPSSSYTITYSTCELAILLKISDQALSYFKKNKPQLWYKLFNLICISLVALERSIDKLDIRLHIETYNRESYV